MLPLLFGGYVFKKLFIFSLFYISALISNSAQAVYFCGEVLKKDDITVVLLGDIHLDKKNKTITNQQVNDLISIAKKINAFWLIEDTLHLHNITTEYIHHSELSGILTKLGLLHCSPLGNFCKILQNNSISFINSECRGPDIDIIGLYELVFKKLKIFPFLYENKIIQNQLSSIQSSLLSCFSLKDRINLQKNIDKNKTTLFELNLFCDFYYELLSNNHKIFVINCGAAHIPPLVDLIKSILDFKQVAYYKTNFRDQLYAYRDNKITATEFEKAQGLDLPKFFDKYVFNQPRSKL